MKGLKYIFILLSFMISADFIAQGMISSDYRVCLGSSLMFKDTSSVPAGKLVVEREWVFGNLTGADTIKSFIDSVFHIYPDPGSFIASVKIKYDDGSFLNVTSTFNIKVNRLPLAKLSVDFPNTCPGNDLTFTCRAYVTEFNAIIDSMHINYNDGLNHKILVDSFVETKYGGYANVGKFISTYYVRDTNKCIDTAQITVNMFSPPKVTFTPINPRCKDSIVLYENRTPNKGKFLNWVWIVRDSSVILKLDGVTDSVLNVDSSFGASVDHYHTHPFATTLASKYQVVILYGRDSFNCVDYDTQYFKVDTTPKLVITPTSDTTICFGASVKITTRGSTKLFYSSEEWMNRINGDSVVLFTPKNTFTYTVFGKSPECPAIGKDIKIHVVQPIETKVTLDPPNILKGQLSKMKLKTNAVFDSLKWTPAATVACPTCDSTSASPQVSTTYKARVFYSSNDYTCSVSDSAFLFVDLSCNIDSVVIANAFTPNGDEDNELFYIKTPWLKTITSLSIYNRWGDRVYFIEKVAPNNPQFGWNGKENNTGEDLPVGVYIYNMKAICPNDQVINFNGEITIIR